jgi:hypothetical protein
LPSAAQIVEAGKFEGVPAAKLDARKSGAFKIGGDTEIHRLGFGAMRITGKGIWGPPEDRPETLRALKRVPELGIVHRRRRLLWPGRRGAESDRACLGAEAQSSDAADSRHLEGQAPRGERRGSRHPN